MIDISVDPIIFNDTYRPHLTNEARTQIFYGGSASGKSVFVTQRVIFDILSGGRNYLVCRAVARTIRRSVFTEITKAILEWGVAHLFTVNKSELFITCENGFQILFAGLDDVEKLKSITPQKGAITDIWIEEATETGRESVKQLLKRQRGGDEATAKRLTLTFNPILKLHWIYQEYFAPIGWHDNQTEYTADDLTILKTWYVHNRFLTRQDVFDLENESDPYFKDVYTYGNWGVLGDVIFRNWETADLSGMVDQFTNHRHGLDFGFSSDPAAIVKTHYDRSHQTIYIYDELYERGLTNDLLAEEVKRMIGREYVICDSAEPKSIRELQILGVGALGARKGPDSIMHGLQWLQQQKIVIDQSCVNTINEFQQYQWQKDKDGNSIRRPVDKMNHLIDSLRYAYENEAENALVGSQRENPFYG